MVNQEVARLTGKVEWVVNNRPLLTLQKNLAKVTQQLTEFSALANKKFNIKVQLDSRTLRAQLDKAANARVVFKNFVVDQVAMEAVQARIKAHLDPTRINLKNIKINVSEVVAQRALLRSQLEKSTVGINVVVKTKEANAALRAWKATTEQRFKLHINADISQSKLFRNAANTLKTVSARLGTFVLKSPKVQLSVDRQHLRAEIASVLEQIRREVRIKIDLNSMVTGNGGGGATRGRSTARESTRAGLLGGAAGMGMSLASGFIPGLGAAYAIGHANDINQKLQSVSLSMTAISESNEEYSKNMAFLAKMADEQGRNVRDIGPEFTSVLASAKGSIGSSGTRDVFRGLMKYGTVMGLDGEAMKGSFRAISQMFSKDKIQAEEAQGQLAERLPAAMQLLAQANGTDVPGLRAKMQAGQLDPKIVIPKLAKIMEDLADANGAYEKALDSTRVQQGRMNREFEKSVKIYSDAGADKGLKEFFRAIADGMEKAEPLIKALGQAFYVMIQPVNALADMVGRLGQMFGGMENGVQQATAGFLMLFAAIFPVTSIVATLILLIDDLYTYMEGGDSVFGRWLASNDDAQKGLDELATSWEKLSNTVKGLFGNIDTTTDKTGKLQEALNNLKFDNELINTMRELKTLIEYINTAIQELKKLRGFNSDGSEDADPNAVPATSPIATAGAYGGSEDVPVTEEMAWENRKNYRAPPAPMNAYDVQRMNNANKATTTLPGINTPIQQAPFGTGTQPQGPAFNAPASPAGLPNIAAGAFSITINGAKDDDEMKMFVRRELENMFKKYMPAEVH